VLIFGLPDHGLNDFYIQVAQAQATAGSVTFPGGAFLVPGAF
jgi:hypothetical protein